MDQGQSSHNDAVRIAYLANQYPAISHTFIRREIVALERLGIHIDRISVRKAAHRVIDPADKEEEQRTTTLLHHPILMVWSVVLVSIRSPIRCIRAFWSALRSGAKTPSGFKYIAYLFEACRLVEHCKSNSLSHVHVHMGTNASAVAQLSRILGGPTYSITMHGPDEWSDPEGYQLACKASGAEFVVCISEFAAAQFRRVVEPEDRDKAIVIRCGVDQAFLNQGPSACSNSQEFVCVGRLCQAKGQDVLINAFSEVLTSHPKATLTLCGDGETRDELQSLITELRLTQSVHIKGWADQDEVIAHLLIARAMVLPSFAEGLPVVIMEAMALGCPVVSTKIAGIHELVQDGFNGWLIEPGDQSALVKAMVVCLSTKKETLDEFGARGRQAVREHHDACKNAIELKNVLLKHLINHS